MKKNLFTLMLASLLVIAMVAFLIGCSDDDDKKSKANDITSFMVTNQIGDAVIDAVNHTVTVNVSVFDVSALVVTIEVSAQASVEPASGSTVDFSGGPVTFVVTAEDGTEQNWVVTVITPTPFQALIKVVDGTQGYVAIKIKGGMNGWTPEAMYDDGTHGDETAGDHTWSLEMNLPVTDTLTTYEWGAIEDDGTEWGIWLIEGGNRVITVSEVGEVTGDLTYEIPVPQEPVNITFKLQLPDGTTPSADGIHVAGNFQNWDPAATELTDPDLDGIYEVTLQIQPEFECLFKFLNGNSWGAGIQEVVPEGCGVGDGYGGYNRSYTTGFTAAVVGYIYGTCTPIGK